VVQQIRCPGSVTAWHKHGLVTVHLLVQPCWIVFHCEVTACHVVLHPLRQHLSFCRLVAGHLLDALLQTVLRADLVKIGMDTCP
jgi:hypothetical protein